MRSVYIHIPFCKSICSYCDFCKFLYKESWDLAYLEILKNEINTYYEGDEVKSIYIGGGTPSSLSSECLSKLFEIINSFNKSNDCEITFECNIDDINDELLTKLKLNKINRISVGIQSFNDKKLKYMNRTHTKKEINYNLKLLRKYDFDNINVDFIYALPIENMIMFKRDFNKFLKLDIDHLSTYSLIIEEHTVVKNNKDKPIKEEIESDMYKYICDKMKKKGFHHYEVSNFSKMGFESVHNKTYWDNEEYYGFGLSSHGYINNVRYENTRNFNKYLAKEYRLNELFISLQETMENELILGLRKLDGISISKFESKFNRNIFEVFEIQKAIDKKLLIRKDDILSIPEDKIYIMNEILNMIM